jgi:hypothetical protein
VEAQWTARDRVRERFVSEQPPYSMLTRIPTRRRRQMEIKPKPPTAKGPAETFTGDVWMDAIVNGEEPSRIRVNLVRFTPGARSAWDSHALGQTLHVTEGVGPGGKPETVWGAHVTDAEYHGEAP